MSKKIVVSCCADCKFRSNYMGGVCDHPSFGINIRVIKEFLGKTPPDWCPLPNDMEDNPELDNTDFAHPAFLRGQDSGVSGVCKRIEDILDGNDEGSGVLGEELLENLRRRLLNIRRITKREIENNTNVLLNAVQMAYRKHHLDDDSIGWEELGNVLLDAICETIGDEEYVGWKTSINNTTD